MRKILLILLLMAGTMAQAQYTQHIQDVGNDRSWYDQKGMVRFMKDVYFKNFTVVDSCAGLGINDSGKLFIYNRCAGTIAYVDSNVFVTMTRLNDSLQVMRGLIANAKPDSSIYATVSRLRDSITALETRILAKGYLTTEADPTVPSSVKAITSTQIGNWDAHLTDNNNPHNTTLDQAAKKNPVTDTSLFTGWQDPGGILSVFGNSISADIYTNPPPVPYYAYLGYRHGQTVKVHAHGGATYYRGYTPHNNNGGLMDSVAKLEVMPTPYSKLIIELGFNDGCQYATSYDTTQIKLSLDSFVAQADIKGWLRGSIGALSAWYIPNPALCNSMTDNDLIIINTAIRNECARLGIHYIDLHTIFANNQKRNLYFTDNVHWSSLGHYIGADEIDREMYPQVYVKGNMRVDGVIYDNKGHQVLSIDTTGRKVIEGETGFDVLPDGKALVTVPFTKYYAGMRASGVTFQGLSTYNYFIGFNLHHNGTTYVTDTPGYSGMIQFADGEISYWQSTGSNTAGAAPTLEKRYKFSSNSRGFGFGGNPGNGGRDDFSGSAMQGDASKLQFNFATKFKYAPDNISGIYKLLVWNIPDSFTQTVSSLPYSFISNRLKYSGGAAFYVPAFGSSDSLVKSDIMDSSNHIGISQNPLSYSRFSIPYSDSMLCAKIGYWNIQSLSKFNMFISNNSYYRRGLGTMIIDTAYDVSFGLYNSANAAGGACFAISATPYLQFGGQPQGQKYAFFRVTNWGTVAIGYHNSSSNIDTSSASIIVTNTTTNPASADQVFFPNVPSYTGSFLKIAVLDGSSSTGKIPANKLTYLSALPVSVITGAVDIAKYISSETPSGTIDGSNTTFTLANTPVSGTVIVFLNGLRQKSGAGNDYTISGSTITYLSAPLSGDVLTVSYISQ